MTKEEFLNYINNTPENTNSAMLLQMLDEYESNGGNVMRVTFTANTPYSTINTNEEKQSKSAGPDFNLQADKTFTEIDDFVKNKKGFVYGVLSVNTYGDIETYFMPLYEYIQDGSDYHTEGGAAYSFAFGSTTSYNSSQESIRIQSEPVCFIIQMLRGQESVKLFEQESSFFFKKINKVDPPIDSNVETLKTVLTNLINELKTSKLMKDV